MRLQLTAFGAQDRGYFEVILCGAPRRQLKRGPLGGSFILALSTQAAILNAIRALLCHSDFI